MHLMVNDVFNGHQEFSKRVNFVFKILYWELEGKSIIRYMICFSFGCPVILSPFLLTSILILVYSVTAVRDVFLPLLCTKTLPLQLLQLFYWEK